MQPQARNLDAGEIDSNGEISDETAEIIRKVEHRDEKYRLDIAGKLEKANASEIIEGIKRTSKRDREEHGKKKRKKASFSLQSH